MTPAGAPIPRRSHGVAASHGGAIAILFLDPTAIVPWFTRNRGLKSIFFSCVSLKVIVCHADSHDHMTDPWDMLKSHSL